MATEISIANLALIRLGQQKISSLSEDNARAEAISIVYEDARRSVLRSSSWNFATKRAQLSKNTTGPAFAYDYSYNLPADFLKLKRLNSLSTDFRIEGRSLVSNETPMKIVYIADEKDASLYDGLFVKAFSYRVAADVAKALVGDESVFVRMEQGYQEALMEARVTDSLESPPDVSHDPSYLVESRLVDEPFRRIDSGAS